MPYNRVRIFPWKQGSESGQLLRDSLEAAGFNCKQVKPDGAYSYKENDVIVNLGNSSRPNWDNAGNHAQIIWLNKPDKVAVAVCKRKTFEALQAGGVSIPAFTTSKQVATEWINTGHHVVCREILNGHSAQGIVFAKTVQELSANSKLFTKYFPKKKEFRVHMIRDKQGVKIFDGIEKKRAADIPKEQVNFQIRSHANGWNFTRDGVVLPNCVKSEAVKAANAVGLDLCSADVCYDVGNDTCVVLEVNTCSSLSGETTLANYTNALKKVLKDEVVTAITVPAAQPVHAAPAQPVAQAPAFAPPIPVPQAQKQNKVQKTFHFNGVSDFSVKQEGDVVTIYGKVAGIAKPVRVFESKPGASSYFWED